MRANPLSTSVFPRPRHPEQGTPEKGQVGGQKQKREKKADLRQVDGVNLVVEQEFSDIAGEPPH